MRRGLSYRLQCGCAAIAFGLSAGSLIYATRAEAATSATASVRDTYARVMFDWGKDVRFSTARNGANLVLKFSESNRASLANVQSTLSPYAKSVSQSADGKTVTIALNDNYKTRNFVSGTKTGVDIIFGSTPRPATKITPATKLTPPAAMKVTAPAPAPAPKAVTAAKVATPEVANTSNTPPKAPKTLISLADIKTDDRAVAALAKEKTLKTATINISPLKEPAPVKKILPKVQKPAPEQKAALPKATAIKTTPPKAPPVKLAAPALVKKPEPITEAAKEIKKVTIASIAQTKVEPKEQPAEAEKSLSEAFIENPPIDNTPLAEPDKLVTPVPAVTAPLIQAVKKTDALPPLPEAPTKQDKIAELIETASIGVAGNNKDMLVTLKKTRLHTELFFNFDERTAVSTFERGSDVYLVFSTPRTIDTKRLNSVTPDYIQNVEHVPSSSGTVLRFTKSADMSLNARKTGRGYEWVIDASRRPSFPKDVVVPKILSDGINQPYIFVDTDETARPIEFRHVVSGEMITTIPSYQSSLGTYPERITQDATMLRTSQGIAYVAHQPDVKAVKLRSGIRIASGAHSALSASLAPLDEANLVKRDMVAQSFFPYEAWKAKDISDFHAKEKILLQDIIAADNKQANRLRLELAKLYMAESMYSEAIGLFEIIEAQDKEFYNVFQVSAINGIAHFMAGRFGQAAQLFASDILQGEEEIEHWKRLVELMQGTDRSFPYSGFRSQYAQFYSPDMQRHIATLAADHALSNKKYQAVNNIINQLERDKLLDPVKDRATYMKGRIAAEQGDLVQAETILRPIIDNVEDRFLRARATYTLETAKYKAGEIDRAALIAALEPLRTVWRGDGFELNLLNLLGELYVNNDNYMEGLRAWRDVVSYFPDTAVAQDASARMANSFVELFNDGKANTLEPLTALSLYYEFRELTPLGNAGDTMIQNLADRLAQVDLLDKAASLLEHQVTFRLEKEDRSRIGAQLALLYLLNREPQKTLNVLELTGYGNNDEALMQKRNHLAAMGYARTGQWKKALNLLEDDFSDAAKYIRMDIHWDNKDWPKVAEIAEDVLASREDLTKKLDKDQTRALLQLGIAYSFMGDEDQLHYLKDYFPPLIADKDKQQSFAVITSAIDPVNRENIDLLSAEMSKLENYLDNYRTSLQEDKLSMSF
jgi:lipopolysaccharide biosynthesis regulator YciM